MTQVRTAIIGAGVMGREHVKALLPLSEVQIVGIADPHEASAQTLAGAAGAEVRAFVDVAAMLAETEPQYVIVASPPKFHAEQAIAAFDAGAHVLCEKPLCMRVAEAEAMQQAAEQAGRLFTVGFQMRQSPAEQAVRRFLADGGLGQV